MAVTVPAGSPCAEPGCGGQVDDLGYCDTCGTKGSASASSAGASSGGGPAAGASCAEPGCGGQLGPMGYCDTCGTKGTPASSATASPRSTGTGHVSASLRAGAFRSGSAAAGSRRVRRETGRTQASRRSGLGRGMVHIETAPTVDPSKVVKDKAEVAESKRFCSNCGEPVGRAKGGRKGRLQGFCPNCRTRFDFVPKLKRGDVVGGQYEVVGALAHGGLGWIYLARDTAVSGRWVVLKGLLNSGDEAAMAAAVAERRFLAEVQHPQIVEIYNFTSHEGAGYTVMEYVGGQSLKQVLKERKKASGEPDPLPVAEAISYVLGVLPAFRYLHGRGLVYCDFKPDNVIQVGDDVKLIDLGGVRRVDDPEGDIYGTVGFQAPEVPTEGVSFSSDLYTIGRTLAVLTMDFRGYTSAYVDSLPDPVDHPALAENEPFLRFLRKATAPHPDDRFQTADEFEEQLLGVLRILVARDTGSPRPGPSTEFTGAPAPHELLPWLAVDPTDPAAAFLQRLPDDADDSFATIEQARADQQVEDTPGLQLRRASDLVELGRVDEALAILDEVLTADPWQWRAVWVQGFAALVQGNGPQAVQAFDRVRSEVPGELAPIFAAAVAAEVAEDLPTAERNFDLVTTVDPAWTKAAEGLARVRIARRDVDGALAAWDRVPATHRARARTQQDAARALLSAGRLDEASRIASDLSLSDRDRLAFDGTLLRRALDGLLDGTMGTDATKQVAGAPLVERDVRLRLEEVNRELARITPDDADRVLLVDAANAVRPWTLF